MTHRVGGWRCAVCGATRDIAESMPWRCPNSTSNDRRHVLAIVPDRTRDDTPERTPARAVPAVEAVESTGSASSLVAHDDDLAWAACADVNGLGAPERLEIVEGLDRAVAAVAGVGFGPTPMGRSDALSESLGFVGGGGVWVKDDSVGVAGSHKARHLVSILLHLLAEERLGRTVERAPLAIASCGNAALAAGVLARAVRWPLEVYVPTWMEESIGRLLVDLGATIHRCSRRDQDPPGDPAMLRFREAVEAGAIPFTVQGPENALCLDAGRTIGWEVADQLRVSGAPTPDRVFAQVGGGAFASCLSRGLREAAAPARLYAVQAEGCAPLARAWARASDDRSDRADVDRADVDRAGVDRRDDAGRYWAELMTPWESPTSVADGILDDETYDWLSVFAEMRATGGAPVVAPESLVVEAHGRATDAGFPVGPTGSAGLAGLLAMRPDIGDDERVLVVMTGAAR